MIPYGKQTIDESDIEAVISVLKSDFLTQGEMVPKFEQAVSSYVGSKYAVGVNSGTAALHLACLALDVKESDCIWTSAISFVASANCARYCGSSVDFIDIDLLTGNMDLGLLEKKLEVSKINNCLPKVIVAVHMAGNPLDMVKLHNLSNVYKFSVIEDASHALGASYACGSKVGCNKYSDITTFSFHPVKMITTAEGGMALTNDSELAKNLKKLSSHGIEKVDGSAPWYYEQTDLGYNYRLSDVHAALGLNQLRKLDEFVYKRREIANFYENNIKAEDVSLLTYNKYGQSSYHLFQIKTVNQLALYQQLKSETIQCQIHYIPIPSQPYYRDLGASMDDFPLAKSFYEKVISIPIFPLLTEQEMLKTVGVINDQSSR